MGKGAISMKHIYEGELTHTCDEEGRPGGFASLRIPFDRERPRGKVCFRLSRNNAQQIVKNNKLPSPDERFPAMWEAFTFLSGELDPDLFGSLIVELWVEQVGEKA